MYIRTKVRTNKSKRSYTYAYLAEIRRKRGKPKQKIIKYLGRVYIFPKKENNEVILNNNNDLKEIFYSLIKTELINHDFKEVKGKLNKEYIEVDIKQATIINSKTNKKACLKLNEGVLCEETLKRLINFDPPKQTMKEISKYFAKCVIEGGINAPEAVLIQIFQKIQTMINTKQHQTMANRPEKI